MSVSIYIHTQEGPPDSWVTLHSWEDPHPHPSATLPIWLLVVTWPQARTRQSKGLYALLARSCLVFKGHLARFQDGFKPAGPFWVPPTFLTWLQVCWEQGWTSGLQTRISVCGYFPFTASVEALPPRVCLDCSGLGPAQSQGLPGCSPTAPGMPSAG